MSPCCATHLGVWYLWYHMFSKQKRHKAYSKLVTHIGMLSNLETFHEYNLDDSVDGARSYAMLSYGKKGRDVDTSYMSCATTWPSQQTNQQQCFPQPKMHVLCAKLYTLIWCKGHVPTKSWSKQLVIAVQLAIMDLSLRQCIICSRWGPKPDSSLLYRQRIYGCQDVSLPASWTMMHRCYSWQQTRSR